MLSAQAQSSSSDHSYPSTLIERLRLLRSSMMRESEAIQNASENLTTEAVHASEWIAETKGCVIVTGVGKAGLVGPVSYTHLTLPTNLSV